MISISLLNAAYRSDNPAIIDALLSLETMIRLSGIKEEHSFKIGTEFILDGDDECKAYAGKVWMVTDVGARTITAICRISSTHPSWYRGPPYAVSEEVFTLDNIKAVTIVKS